jgi:hypothetical protein
VDRLGSFVDPKTGRKPIKAIHKRACGAEREAVRLDAGTDRQGADERGGA